ncbi:hypothetical protein [Azospirillum brasilense]|uniref:hypothetical protein n=1 Tax=Azospirillum brasilense TaxID=192 RepID=UPI0009A2BB38|nr:hypothetical protein [Azospirillum brasilense]
MSSRSTATASVRARSRPDRSIAALCVSAMRKTVQPAKPSIGSSAAMTSSTSPVRSDRPLAWGWSSPATPSFTAGALSS